MVSEEEEGSGGAEVGGAGEATPSGVQGVQGDQGEEFEEEGAHDRGGVVGNLDGWGEERGKIDRVWEGGVD